MSSKFLRWFWMSSIIQFLPLLSTFLLTSYDAFILSIVQSIENKKPNENTVEDCLWKPKDSHKIVIEVLFSFPAYRKCFLFLKFSFFIVCNQKFSSISHKYFKHLWENLWLLQWFNNNTSKRYDIRQHLPTPTSSWVVHSFKFFFHSAVRRATTTIWIFRIF